MKKITSLFLTTILALSCFSFTAFATDTTKTADVWDGSVATGFADGDGTAENPYQIATGAQLAYFSTVYVPQDFYETYVVLTNDIDLNNNEWTPIGSVYTKYFCGTFDGQNHTVSNMQITVDAAKSNDTKGFFGVSQAEIKNFNVQGKMDVNVAVGGSFFGGLVGLQAYDMDNCTSDVDITFKEFGNSCFIGGVTGDLQGGATMTNCINYGNINYFSDKAYGDTCIGGITGDLQYSTIKSCKNAGDITSNAKIPEVAGIAGFAYNNDKGDALISNCYNTGTLTCNADASAGGIVAKISSNSTSENAYTITVENCFSIGELKGTSTKMGAVYSETKTISDGTINFSNLYFLSTSASDTPLDNPNATSITATNTADFLEKMTADSGVDSWSTDADGNVVLAMELADYTAVNAEIAKIPTDLSCYTDASVKALTDAKNGVVEGKKKTEQSAVDAFATAIKTAIAGLILKPADYSAVDTALAKIPADLSGYTADSVKALSDAKAKIVKYLDITKQSEVDGFVTAIETALTNLKKAETKPVTSPNTGDFSTAPILVLLAAVSSLSVLVFAKKKMAK